MEFLGKNANTKPIKLDIGFLGDLGAKTMASTEKMFNVSHSTRLISYVCTELMIYGADKKFNEISIEEYINHFLNEELYIGGKLENYSVKSMFYSVHFEFLMFAFKMLTVHQNLPQLFEEVNNEKNEEKGEA